MPIDVDYLKTRLRDLRNGHSDTAVVEFLEDLVYEIRAAQEEEVDG